MQPEAGRRTSPPLWNILCEGNTSLAAAPFGYMECLYLSTPNICSGKNILRYIVSECTNQQKVDTFFIFYTLKTEHSTPYIVLVSNSLMSMQVFLH